MFFCVFWGTKKRVIKSSNPARNLQKKWPMFWGLCDFLIFRPKWNDCFAFWTKQEVFLRLPENVSLVPRYWQAILQNKYIHWYVYSMLHNWKPIFRTCKFNPQTSTNVFPEWKKCWVMAKKLRGSNPNPKPKWISCFLLQVRLFGIHPRLYFTKKAIAGLHWWRSCALMWRALLPVVILHNLFRFAGALERIRMQEKTTRGLDMIYNQKRFGYFFLKTSFGTF